MGDFLVTIYLFIRKKSGSCTLAIPRIIMAISLLTLRKRLSLWLQVRNGIRVIAIVIHSN